MQYNQIGETFATSVWILYVRYFMHYFECIIFYLSSFHYRLSPFACCESQRDTRSRFQIMPDVSVRCVCVFLCVFLSTKTCLISFSHYLHLSLLVCLHYRPFVGLTTQSSRIGWNFDIAYIF